jgi:hypothetical protein
MNRELAIKVADAVLYEGYMLYPYRRSAVKNRQRWSLGILYPPRYREVAEGTERCNMHSECLLRVTGEAVVQLELRFLQLVGKQLVQSTLEAWDEGVERSVQLEWSPQALPNQLSTFNFAGRFETEPWHKEHGQASKMVSCTQHEITGTICVKSESVLDNVLKLVIDVTNTTPLPADASARDAALLRALLSAHTILTACGAEFISLLDPPEDLREATGKCRNQGNFPVLVGDQGKSEHDMMLCSPVLLYDYPQIAPESNGDFYDSTEMDEMLTLRMMTLTEEEKSEMRGADERVRELLERTERSAREQLMRTHGAIRSLRPVSEKP